MSWINMNFYEVAVGLSKFSHIFSIKIYKTKTVHSIFISIIPFKF